MEAPISTDVALPVFVRAFAARGLLLRLSPAGDGLQIVGDRSQTTDAHRGYIRHHKPALMEALRGQMAPPFSCAGTVLPSFSYPVVIRSAVLQDTIIFAGDECALAPLHSNTVVYRPREMAFLREWDAVTLRGYHKGKRALLTAWMAMAGSGWVCEREMTRGYGADKTTVPESKTNLRVLAKRAGLDAVTADDLVGHLHRGGIVAAWCPDNVTRYRLITALYPAP